MKKGSIIAGSVILVAVLAAAIMINRPAENSGPPQKASVSVYRGEASAILYLAEKQGFFRAHGLDVTLIFCIQSRSGRCLKNWCT